MAVNDIDLTNASHDRAVEVIRNACSPIRFIIQSLIYANEPSSTSAAAAVAAASSSSVSAVVSSEVNVEKKAESEESSISSKTTADEYKNKANSHDEPIDASKILAASQEEPGDVDSDRVIVSQPNKYNYSLDQMNEKYSYLLETATSADSLAPPKTTAAVSGGGRRIYIFKLTRSFLGESLGLSLSGNVNLNKTSVFVCGIYANSIAHRHSLIRVSDQILEINGQSIYGRAHSNVTPLIKNIRELDVFLVVLR